MICVLIVIHCFWLMFLKTLGNICLEIYQLDPAKFLLAPVLVKLELLTDIDMLLMVEKGIRGGICHSINRYVKFNNKYMTEYDENKESSYVKYLDVSNLFGWEMSQKLSVTDF